MKTLYLDSSSTSSVSPYVLKEMIPYFTKYYGNPSSPHLFGTKAMDAINKSRKYLAEIVGCKAHEIVFTSGVTESNNMAFFGLSGRKKIIVSAVEHSSIFDICSKLEKQGFKIVVAPVNKEGIVDVKVLEKEIDSSTLLVSICHVSNVLGSIQPIREIGKMCKSKNVLFHVDASQSFCKLPINVRDMNIDLLSASAHKIGGPKGVGLLYVRDGLKLEPLIVGSQERGLRGGTENVPGIVGFSSAAKEYLGKKKSLESLRTLLVSKLQDIGGIVNGSSKNHLSQIVHVSFSGIDAEMLVQFLSDKDVYVSKGSACDSKKVSEDRVLEAIGLDDDLIRGSVRITLSNEISKTDVGRIVRLIDSFLTSSRL